MDEQYYEKLLNIKTAGEQKSFYESIHYNRYEPTSYLALEALSKEYIFTEEDNVIDFGCGKGRFGFYINHFFNSSVTGIEMNSLYYNEAVENKRNYFQTFKSKRDKLKFINCFAEKYLVNPSDNKFYFFNPFSMQIFMKVINNILSSTEEYERTADVILYYPSSDYTYSLENSSPFQLIEEIRVPVLYERDPRHCFLIYRA